MKFNYKLIINMKLMKLDAIDRLILQQLQRDASLNNQDLAQAVHTSAPTCLRRIQRMRDVGLIERQIAILNPDVLAQATGHGQSTIVEITLDRQSAEDLARFESRVLADGAVQQCYRVSPGPDFVLVVHTTDMPAYLAVVQRLFTSDANVRNVKAYFSIKRSKFGAEIPL